MKPEIMKGSSNYSNSSNCSNCTQPPLFIEQRTRRPYCSRACYRRNWMINVPDNATLSQLTIPGTHDSYAYEPTAIPFVQTQEWNVTQQLERGIRYLDIRIGSDDLGIYHGIVYLNAQWSDVVHELRSFLAQYPSEVILLRIKNEQFFNSITIPFDDSLFIREEGTVGAMRGRILLVKHKNVLDNHIVTWVGLEEKIRDCLRHLRGGNITYFSGSVGMLPRTVAEAANGALLVLDERLGALGVVVMDFPTVELLDKLLTN